MAQAAFTVVVEPGDSGETPTTPLTGVTLSGEPRVGKPLTATVAPDGATATYEWYRIKGETQDTISGVAGGKYTPRLADVGYKIKVVANGCEGYSGSVASNVIGPVVAADAAAEITGVTLSGEEKVGETLTASVTPSGASVTYQWSRSADGSSFTPIPTAAGETYRLTGSDQDRHVKVEVTGVAPYYGTKSAVTGKIAAGVPVDPNRVPSISGGGSFDPDYKRDVSFALDPGAGTGAINVGKLKVEKGGAALAKGTDYTLTQTAGGMYELVFKKAYLSTLPAGVAKFDVTAPYSGTSGYSFKQTVTIRIEQSGSTDSGSDDGDSSTGGGFTGGSAAGGSMVSNNVSPTTGAVKGSVAVNDVKKAVQNASGDNATVSVRNAKTIDARSLKKMANAAGRKSVILHADKTAANGAVVARLYIDVKEAAKLGKNLNLDVTVGNTAVSNHFNKYFKNHLQVVSFSQKGSFGMNVGVALKVDLSPLSTDNLVFYSYDLATNKYTDVKSTYFVDKNGYLHLTVGLGDNLIITDQELTRK